MTLLTSTNSQFSLYIKAFLFLWPHFGQLFKKFYSTTALNCVALVMFSSVIILSLFSIQFCYRQNRLLHVAKYNKSTDQLVKGKRWVPEWGRWIHHQVFLCAWGWSVFFIIFLSFQAFNESIRILFYFLNDEIYQSFGVCIWCRIS